MRHPHQEAQELRSTFRPRSWERLWRRPSRSGSVKSGATSERRVVSRTSPAGPHTQTLPASSWTTAWPRWRASAARLTAPSVRTSSARRAGGIGTQSGPRQRPSGSRAQPRCCSSDGASQRSSSCASRSEEHTSELQSHVNLVCRLLLEKKKKQQYMQHHILKKKNTNNY